MIGEEDTKSMKNANWGKGKSSWNKGVPRSQSTKDKISAKMSGAQGSSYGKRDEDAHNWKGNKAGVSAMHKWVCRKNGAAKDYVCASCGKRIADDWANIDHSYRRRLKDYAPLCVKCHRAYDKMKEEEKKIQAITIKIFNGLA